VFFEKIKFDTNLNEEFFISNKLESIILISIKKNGKCKICVSGGSSPNKVLVELSKSNKIDWTKVIFFLSDERVTSIDSEDSNYYNLQSIFKKIPISIKPFYDGFCIDKSVFRYQKYLKKYLKVNDPFFDLLVLGFGEDGHIASLFPDDKDLLERQEDVIHINKIVNGFDRLTISMKRLKKTKQTIIISYGQTKYNLLKSDIKNEYPISEFLKDQKNVSWFYSV